MKLILLLCYYHNIALSSNNDMFVTSSTNYCIYIYDNCGRLKFIIGSSERVHHSLIVPW